MKPIAKPLAPLVLGAVVTILGLAPGVAARSEAELEVLTDGSFFKVSAYQLEDFKLFLTLPEGGRITLPLERVERVVDDEVIPIDEPVEIPAEPIIEERSWRFAEDDEVPGTPYGEEIFDAARRHEMNPTLVAALIRAESAYDRYALSNKGARGLMQLMPATAKRFGVAERQLFEPKKNLEAGVKYLRWLYDRFDEDLPRALAAYNAGEGAVDRYGGVPPYRETRNYLRRIYSFLGISLPEGAL